MGEVVIPFPENCSVEETFMRPLANLLQKLAAMKQGVTQKEFAIHDVRNTLFFGLPTLLTSPSTRNPRLDDQKVTSLINLINEAINGFSPELLRKALAAINETLGKAKASEFYSDRYLEVCGGKGEIDERFQCLVEGGILDCLYTSACLLYRLPLRLIRDSEPQETDWEMIDQLWRELTSFQVNLSSLLGYFRSSQRETNLFINGPTAVILFNHLQNASRYSEGVPLIVSTTIDSQENLMVSISNRSRFPYDSSNANSGTGYGTKISEFYLDLLGGRAEITQREQDDPTYPYLVTTTVIIPSEYFFVK